jgi:hypothetical protein
MPREAFGMKEKKKRQFYSTHTFLLCWLEDNRNLPRELCSPMTLSGD